MTGLLSSCVCGTCGFYRIMHGSVSDPSFCAFVHRVAFEEVSGHRVLSKCYVLGLAHSIYWLGGISGPLSSLGIFAGRVHSLLMRLQTSIKSWNSVMLCIKQVFWGSKLLIWSNWEDPPIPPLYYIIPILCLCVWSVCVCVCVHTHRHTLEILQNWLQITAVKWTLQ